MGAPCTTRLVFLYELFLFDMIYIPVGAKPFSCNVKFGCVKVADRVVTIFSFAFFFYGMNSWLGVNHHDHPLL